MPDTPDEIEALEPPVEVIETFVPLNASTVIEPAAVTVTNWPTALPVWVIVPPPRPEKAACMVMLPDGTANSSNLRPRFSSAPDLSR